MNRKLYILAVAVFIIGMGAVHITSSAFDVWIYQNLQTVLSPGFMRTFYEVAMLAVIFFFALGIFVWVHLKTKNTGGNR